MRHARPHATENWRKSKDRLQSFYMTIRLKNTLTRQVEEFTAIHPGKVGLYSCGPTVYSRPSIGNYRAFLFSDLLRRMLELSGYEVRQIINITDVGHLSDDASEGEDKVERKAKAEGKTAWDISREVTEWFLDDMKALNIKMPHKLPKATEHIGEQIKLIQDLESNGFTYVISDGVYFDTSKFSEYGQLSGQKLEEKQEGARVEVNSEKRNAADFALWKFSKEGEQRHMEWPSPWGVGFPGWHIECSAMSEMYLGTPFDIHTGGIDHIPVHHTNEIAQTKCASGNDLAHYWMHNGFLKVDGGKMGKSLGNAYTLPDLAERGFVPLDFRYFVLGAHYSATQNFTWEALEAARNARKRLVDIVSQLPEIDAAVSDIPDQFFDAIQDDLDTPKALAILWEVAKADIDDELKAKQIRAMDLFFGLRLSEPENDEIPEEIRELAEKRRQAKLEKNYAEADAIRATVESQGYEIRDEGATFRIVRK